MKPAIAAVTAFGAGCLISLTVTVAALSVDTIRTHRRADARKEAARIAQSYLRT